MDAPFAAVVPEFARLCSTAGWANAFLALGSRAGTRYVELTYIAEPASSFAPAAMVYPSRASSWIYPLAGIALRSESTASAAREVDSDPASEGRL